MAELHPQETLFVVARKRFVPLYGKSESGGRELSLLVGRQEITFDEPELFPWAETLIEKESFIAGSATEWSGEPLEWPRVQGLLESLMEAGLVARAPPLKFANVALSTTHLDFLRDEEKRPVLEGPRSWNPDPGPTLREITGRDLPLGYIETAMPVHRLVHIALDREGRQVGEGNTFPSILRLKLETDWKSCNYAGSRYGLELPMNMTALRSMLAHWKPVLRATRAFREEFLKRYPQLPDGRWKLGDLLLCASGILALPVLQVMRFRHPVRTGELDPVLSSLFRVTDGVRMVTSYMLDLYERPMEHDTPVTPKVITDAAEREGQYRSAHGVCAGPQSMIDEFLRTLMTDGEPAVGEPAAWYSDIPQALDYALLGVQLNAAISTLWVRMAAAYERIRELLPESGSALRKAVERDWQTFHPNRTNLPVQREHAEAFYRRAFHHAQLGLRGARTDLAVELTPPPDLLGEAAAGALRDLGLPRELVEPVLGYLRVERCTLQVVSRVQREINTLLERPQPVAPLTGNQLSIGHALRKGSGQQLAYLPATILEALGIAVENEPSATRFTRDPRGGDLQ